MPSRDFDVFVETFFGAGTDALSEGPNEDALARLQGEERRRAEAMLLDRLGPDDSRPAVGLGVLRSRAAASSIRALLTQQLGKVQDADAESLVDTSLSLWRIEKAPDAIANIAWVLGRNPFATIRARAAVALRKTGDPGAIPPLLGAVERDPDSLVRHQAVKSLLVLHGLLDDPRQSPPLAAQVMSRAPAVRQKAMGELRELLAKHPMRS